MEQFKNLLFVNPRGFAGAKGAKYGETARFESVKLAFPARIGESAGKKT
ncbi:hypothetical protein [Pseudophaeobacter arcticus]|jgi:hypothetical protein|nr:hypothetical protein [Pseudophaeobacter arcticus]